jgi:HEAT repeat protein
MRKLALLLAWLLVAPAAGAAEIDEATLRDLLGDWDRFEAIEAMGPDVLPVLARIYEETPDPEQRRTIANVFYGLGWESPEAKRALLTDLHTDNVNLRLSVQWALGRVSADDDVVPLLLDIMQEDPNALFRDKAACALASDQIHIDPAQRARLFAGLIDSLEDSKPQVRDIALKALRIHTGQDKGFRPGSPAAERAAAVARWRRWLEDYRAAL